MLQSPNYPQKASFSVLMKCSDENAKSMIQTFLSEKCKNASDEKFFVLPHQDSVEHRDLILVLLKYSHYKRPRPLSIFSIVSCRHSNSAFYRSSQTGRIMRSSHTHVTRHVRPHRILKDTALTLICRLRPDLRLKPEALSQGGPPPLHTPPVAALSNLFHQ